MMYMLSTDNYDLWLLILLLHFSQVGEKVFVQCSINVCWLTEVHAKSKKLKILKTNKQHLSSKNIYQHAKGYRYRN